LFIYEGKTFAEVDLETKNKVSHRALALKDFIVYFENKYNL
jgi:inosine/xanthosine triphosphate pyrophosphatase family protein